ncbi:lipopolysaccharide biosynthesis protein [Erythrobacteraceae bacterium CFH 75059]|uniref:lipopolysaccharide biosynthesis protein n=1 Tax=Qipengyuania thermophila TaxID=2509361 RepID=UPI00102128B6|nr:oligosaccharide flippase family protein [Qipengyuania thermophila]TCD04828.1 lipopolysaccharide biosynthesis protein [Erythrobacteraceae bacterium CFH 75059]
MRRLARNLGWLLGGRGLNAVLSLVYLAVATRTLGLEAFGVLAVVLAMGQTVAGLAGFQTWQLVVRWGSGPDGPAEATGFAVALDLVSVAIGVVLAAALAGTAALWLPVPAELGPAMFAYGAVLACCTRSTPIGLLRRRFAYARAASAEAVQPVMRVAGAFLASAFLPTVTGFLLAWAVAEIAVAAAVWIAALSQERLHGMTISLRHLPRSHPDVWRFVWSTNLLGSLNVGSKQILILLVGAVGGDAAAGGFRVAAQLGQGLMQLAQLLSKAVYPELVQAGSQAVDMARRIATLALVAGVAAAVVAVVAGRWLLDVIAGPQFSGVYWTMVILAIAGAVEMTGASLESLLISAGRAGTTFLVRAAPLALGFVMLDAAIGWQGLKGAAFVVLFASALSVLGLWTAMLSLRIIRLAPEAEADDVSPVLSDPLSEDRFRPR